ncbi:hypothetical protein HPB51_017202 [Rhipicephalus microplus]|uniref:Uncharacterized protein n=1 Tax=Rhipicephalus microplus TaxID=6941 RepID=A0A9J6EAS0_RHIMP|nr:hypothetical protein HPB51_017202 [Rhipicephalus microplus]
MIRHAGNTWTVPARSCEVSNVHATHLARRGPKFSLITETPTAGLTTEYLNYHTPARPVLVCQLMSALYGADPAERRIISGSIMPRSGLCDYFVLDIPVSPDGSYQRNGYSYLPRQGQKYLFSVNLNNRQMFPSKTTIYKPGFDKEARIVQRYILLYGFGIFSDVPWLDATAIDRDILRMNALGLKPFYEEEAIDSIAGVKSPVVTFAMTVSLRWDVFADVDVSLLRGKKLNNVQSTGHRTLPFETECHKVFKPGPNKPKVMYAGKGGCAFAQISNTDVASFETAQTLELKLPRKASCGLRWVTGRPTESVPHSVSLWNGVGGCSGHQDGGGGAAGNRRRPERRHESWSLFGLRSERVSDCIPSRASAPVATISRVYARAVERISLGPHPAVIAVAAVEAPRHITTHASLSLSSLSLFLHHCSLLSNQRTRESHFALSFAQWLACCLGWLAQHAPHALARSFPPPSFPTTPHPKGHSTRFPHSHNAHAGAPITRKRGTNKRIVDAAEGERALPIGLFLPRLREVGVPARALRLCGKCVERP